MRELTEVMLKNGEVVGVVNLPAAELNEMMENPNFCVSKILAAQRKNGDRIEIDLDQIDGVIS